jgi:hypothetical protein
LTNSRSASWPQSSVAGGEPPADRASDDGAYMRIRNPQHFEGYYEIHNKLKCRSYHDDFIEMWEACEPDQNTRRLSL